MITSILSILYYTFLILWPILVGFSIGWLLRRVTRLENQTKKLNLDINSLQRNQTRLVLTIKELYRELRKRDKSLKRQIRVAPGSQEEGSEES
jgi:peptidoglycan hydrolase CwlO-like protein